MNNLNIAKDFNSSGGLSGIIAKLANFDVKIKSYNLNYFNRKFYKEFVKL